MPDNPIISVRDVSVRFPGVLALDNVSFDVRPGEVHALCGENGAGKSTLMKILAGAITDYEGRDRPATAGPVRFSGPRDAEDAGIRIIYQELNLVPELSVAANIFLGRERTRRLGLLDDRAMEAEARRLFERLGTPIDARGPGSATCGSATSRWSRSPRRWRFDAAILIMDEPTSALSDAEVDAALPRHRRPAARRRRRSSTSRTR